jgi:DNA mismatch repair protein MutL
VHQLIAPALRARLAAAAAPAAPAAAAVGEATAPYAPRPFVLEAAPTAGEAGVQPGLWAPVPRGFASLRFIGQIFDGYLLCEGEGRVVLIDQHAAHERVVFERLRAERRAGGVARDPLLVPETIELPAAEAAALAERLDALAAAGLEGEPFGECVSPPDRAASPPWAGDAGALVRRSPPTWWRRTAAPASARQSALATIACHSVVRVGQSSR